MLRRYTFIFLVSATTLFAMEKEIDQTIQKYRSCQITISDCEQFLAMRKIQRNALEYYLAHKDNEKLELDVYCRNSALPSFKYNRPGTEQGLLLKFTPKVRLSEPIEKGSYMEIQVDTSPYFFYSLITPWGTLDLLSTKDNSIETKKKIFPTATFAPSKISNLFSNPTLPVISVDEITRIDEIELPMNIEVKIQNWNCSEEEHIAFIKTAAPRVAMRDKLVQMLENTK